MLRPPRDPGEPLFRARTLLTSVLQGAFVLGLTLALLFFGGSRGYDEQRMRTLVFLVLGLSNVGLILVGRSPGRTTLRSLTARNAALWSLIGATLALFAACLAVAPVQRILGLGPPSAGDVALILGGGLSGLIGMEIIKVLVGVRPHSPPVVAQEGRSGAMP